MNHKEKLKSLQSHAFRTLVPRIKAWFHDNLRISERKSHREFAKVPSPYCIEKIQEIDTQHIVIQYQIVCPLAFKNNESPGVDDVKAIIKNWEQKHWKDIEGFDVKMTKYENERSEVSSAFPGKTNGQSKFWVTIAITREPMNAFEFKCEFTDFVSCLQGDRHDVLAEDLSEEFVQCDRTFIHRYNDNYTFVWNLVCNTQGFELDELNRRRKALHDHIDERVRDFQIILKANKSDRIISWDMEAHHHRRDDGYLLGTMFSICIWAQKWSPYGSF